MATTDNGETSTTGAVSAGPTDENSPLSRGRNPATVSSLSSIETAAYDYSDAAGNLLNSTSDPLISTQQSAIPPQHSLPPLPTTTNSSNDDHSLSLSQMYFQADPTQTEQNHSQQQSQPLSSHLTTASGPLMGQTTMRLSPTTRVIVPAAPTVNTVPEFLCSLTKMLTDNNRDIIEWSNGKIEVHNPHKLETHVLNRYFRHSKFASFQRQLNYFGFRKLAGKGKMAPCSYVNDSTSHELGSLLLVKRKQGNEPKAKNGKKRELDESSSSAAASANASSYNTGQAMPSATAYRPPGNNINNGGSSITVNQNQKALARVAVGKGVRHGFVPKSNGNGVVAIGSAHKTPSVVAPSPVQASLSALTDNYRNSLNELQHADQGGPSNETQGTGPASSHMAEQSTNNILSYVPGSLRRDDSLVDLAMIPMAEEGTDSNAMGDAYGFSFVDFPFDPDFLTNDLNELPQE